MQAVPGQVESDTYSDVLSFVQKTRPEHPVYCLRPAVLRTLARDFLAQFPGKVLYAVKCNSEPRVIDTLFEAGITDFETASLPEIEQVSALGPGVGAWFMHPSKIRSSIAVAYHQYGVRHFAVDHQTELQKLAEEIGGSPMVVMVRVRTARSSDALYTLSEKFGTSADKAVQLLQEAERLGYEAGITFHVGSQCLNPGDFATALDLVGDVLRRAGVEPVAVDVGGGFPIRYPGVDAPPLSEYVREISDGIKNLDLPSTTTVCAEPGRALVGPACSLLTQVVLRKSDRVYLNDGVHGGLSELLDSNYQLNTRVFRLDGSVSQETKSYRLFGPTCDSIDRLPPDFNLPTDLREGDWIEFDQVGAYSNALSTTFNGFGNYRFIVVEK